MEVFLAQNDDLSKWNNSDLKTFALLKQNTTLASFNTKIKDFLKTKDKNLPET